MLTHNFNKLLDLKITIQAEKKITVEIWSLIFVSVVSFFSVGSFEVFFLNVVK